jgi:MarR family transcriptional regulator, 2-MHQ and catechol-resistance regulon repressor
MPSHFNGSESQVKALSAFINLLRASDTVTDRAAEHVDSTGLTFGQFAVLESLYHLGPMCQHTLAKKLLRSGGNMTVVIDNLERSGMAKRVRSKIDRRMVEIQLTLRGRKLIERVFPAHAGVVEKLMAALTPEEQDELRRIAAKLGRSAARVESGGAGRAKKGETR